MVLEDSTSSTQSNPERQRYEIFRTEETSEVKKGGDCIQESKIHGRNGDSARIFHSDAIHILNQKITSRSFPPKKDQIFYLAYKKGGKLHPKSMAAMAIQG